MFRSKVLTPGRRDLNPDPSLREGHSHSHQSSDSSTRPEYASRPASDEYGESCAAEPDPTYVTIFTCRCFDLPPGNLDFQSSQGNPLEKRATTCGLQPALYNHTDRT